MNSCISSSLLKTQLLDDVAQAAEFLRLGKLVAFPTETVFGLGADASNPHAIERLFAAKGRPADNPLIVHVGAIEDWPLAASELPDIARRILELFSPGPVSVVVAKADAICASVTAGLDTVALRIPAPQVTQALLRAAQLPIAAPSANLSGRPSATTWQSVLEDLDGRIDAILCTSVEHVGLESTVIDCTGRAPIVLRPGSIGLAQLRAHFPSARLWNDDLSGQSPGAGEPAVQAAACAPLSSPGLRHPHYQPRARVQLLEAGQRWPPLSDASSALADLSYAYAGMAPPPRGMRISRQFNSLAEYAHGFYEFLREADRANIDVIGLEAIAIETARESGIAAALCDRQRRAAGLN